MQRVHYDYDTPDELDEVGMDDENEYEPWHELDDHDLMEQVRNVGPGGYSELASRRTSRTTARAWLYIGFVLRQPNTWFNVHDHLSNNQSNLHLCRRIQKLVDYNDLEGIEVHRSALKVRYNLDLRRVDRAINGSL